MSEQLVTPITKLFGIKHPVLLAGMNVAAGPELAAAVTNAGGLGVIGGVGYTPDFLRKQIATLKSHLKDKNAPFGVDLLLPKVGGGARATNYDYTEGQLPELIDIIIESKATLFVSAIGVPPRSAVSKLHGAGILVMNMVGAPKHVAKALDAGVDIICAQGGEGGGHTGDIPTSLLIPACVDAARGRVSPITGKQVPVIAAGGIVDSRGLAMALGLGADAVWVGTRFVCAAEAGAPPRHQQAVVDSGYNDTIRTLIFTGRPLRVVKNPYIMEWETSRANEIRELTARGVIPYKADVEKHMNDPDIEFDASLLVTARPLLTGQACGAIKDIKPAKEIIDEMVTGAIRILRRNHALISNSRL